MNRELPDVDVDVRDRPHALAGSNYVRASLLQDGDLRPHNTGVFYQNIPVDPVSGLASFYSGKKGGDLASEMGYFKLDIIPSNAYKLVESPEDMDELLESDIDWDLLMRQDVVEKLQQLGRHFDIVFTYEPKSIEDLACLIAVIRPGKRHLLGEEWDVLRKEVWKADPEGGYSYKKSHAFAYAHAIIVQLMSMKRAGEFDGNSE